MGCCLFLFVLLQFVHWKAQRGYCQTGLESKLLPRLCFIYFVVIVLFCGFLVFGFGMDIRERSLFNHGHKIPESNTDNNDIAFCCCSKYFYSLGII